MSYEAELGANISAMAKERSELKSEIERQSKLIDELVEALESLTYKDGEKYRSGVHGDADVTDEVAAVLSKAQSHKPNEGQRDE